MFVSLWDFEELFKKLASDYKHILNDDEKLENNNKMQVVRVDPQMDQPTPDGIK